jgi:hypothetical protein
MCDRPIRSRQSNFFCLFSEKLGLTMGALVGPLYKRSKGNCPNKLFYTNQGEEEM